MRQQQMTKRAAWAAGLLCLAAAALRCRAASWSKSKWWDPTASQAPVFQGAQFYNITEKIGFTQIPGSVVGFGDFNSDTFTDIFVLDNNERNVSVYLWIPDEWKFNTAPYVTVQLPHPVVNVAPNDLNYDGHLDALVTCLDPADNKLVLYSAISATIGAESQPALNVTEVARDFDDQVLLLDWNGDYFVDILGRQSGATVVLLNDGNATFAGAAGAAGLPVLSVPNSNAFVDLDGDCHADLVLTEAPQNGETRVHMSVWLYRNGTYQRHVSHALPPGAGQLAFADFDRDGAIDLAFPVCWPQDTCGETEALVLVRNVQRPLCGGVLAGGACRSMTAMCEADPDFRLADFAALNTTADVTVVGRDVFERSRMRLYTGDAAQAASAGTPPTRPLAFTVGDYNLDGYPDLLVPMVNTDAGTDRAPRIQLWENVRCNSSTCSALGAAADRTAQRVFVRQTAGMDELSQARGAYAAAFMDFGESGAPGVVVLTEAQPAPPPAEGSGGSSNGNSSSSSSGGGGARQVHAVFNNFRLDALFIKAQGLNGICTAWCPTAPQFPSPKPYGVNYPGGAFKFALTDTDGTNLGAAGAQLYRTAYHSLQTPYVMFGLGRISNYIQTVFYGTAAADSRPQNYWQGIIPNSYIFAIPYPHDKPASWTIELFLAPSSVVFFVILVVLLSLIALGVLIIIFKSREIKEDKKLREEARHVFDFNSL